MRSRDIQVERSYDTENSKLSELEARTHRSARQRAVFLRPRRCFPLESNPGIPPLLDRCLQAPLVDVYKAYHHLVSDRTLTDSTNFHTQTVMATAEWQNTGTFGPEQADIDVAYATSLPPEAALTWVEARITEVQSHFANLGTKRNNLFPVYHLPKAVLFQILSWVALSDPSSKSEQDPYRDPADQTKDLLRLSQACKLFRDAALERPELWVRVNLGYPTLAKVFLERSGDKPVTVFLNPPHPANAYSIRSAGPIPLKVSTLEILRQHLDRITDLELSFALQIREGYCGENPLAMHMPALRTLQLRNIRKGEDSAVFSSDSDPPLVPPIVFLTPNDPYPQLRKVVFASVGVPWNSSLFNGLTELELVQQGLDLAPKIEEFLTVLEHCPGLEKLHLNNSGPKGLPDTPTAADAKKVQLPHLQDLSIHHDEGRYMDIPLLLARVSIQPSTKIHIQCNEAVDPVIRFSQMFPTGHPFFTQLPKYGTLKHLHSFTFFHFRLIDESDGGFLSFKVNRRDQTVQTGPSILDFFRVFGESAQYAEIYPGADINPWMEILESLPNVESVKLKRELDHGNFVVALSTQVCPKLKNLSFEYYSHTAECQSTWLAAVKTRAENGMKLEEFDLAFAQGGELLTGEAVSEFQSYTGKFSHGKLRAQS